MMAALFAAFTVPAHADEARSAYKRGVQAEKYNKYDEAYEAFKEAQRLKPRDAEYLAAFTRMKFYAAAEHVRTGQGLRESGKLADALAEYTKAAAIDQTNIMAQQEIRQTTELLKKQEHKDEPPVTQLVSPLVKMAEQAGGPAELQFSSNSPITLRLSENADVAYKIVAKLAGINVLFDPEFKAQRLSVELNDVTPREALNMVALQSKTFWQPVSNNTIMVAADTPGKRKDRQNNIMTTFYLRNVSTSSDLQDAANTIKGILDLSRIQLIPRQNAIVMRGTSDQLVLAQKLLSDIDKPKPEVVIDIVVMQIRRDKVRTMGINLPNSTSVALVPGGGIGATSGSGTFTINSLRNINATNFQVAIPSATLSALMTDGNTKIIQNPEIRALDSEKATLKIGDRVPIATGSFSGGGGASVSPLVNTQFQYLDVGVNIDVTPHIHPDHEVTLKMTLEISSVTGSQNLGGVTQPIIGQRRIEHEMRLHDGDINLVGGILEDSETQSLSGYPGLLKIPVLKYLFGQENKEMRENEIVFAITPHIVRGQDLDEQNLRPVDIGTGSVVEMRHPTPDAPANTSAKAGARVAPGAAKAKPAPTVGANPPVAVPAPSSAPAAIAPPPPQFSTKVDANRASPANPGTNPGAGPGTNPGTTEASKADPGTDSCPKGATPEHPIGCYLNGNWRVDIGDGRGYQQPPGSSGSATTNRDGPAKGVTGTSIQQDPKAAPASGPIV
jgi:general secretion pathway protein D